MKMTLEEMKMEYDATKVDLKQCQTKTAQSGINNALYELKKKIDAEQHREDATLEKLIQNGIEYKIPRAFNWWESRENFKMMANGEVLYVIDASGRLDEDGSYHWHHYAWIPQAANKYAKLCVRTLGGDRFNDRYFLEVKYYKHPVDPYPYLSKHLSYNNQTYKLFVEYILKELKLTDRLANYKGR
ncbi:hypothetical protein ACFQZE_06585 [Paenibacillus sp. GCM10027627]|uniref:hypothetical protein n=1 Tax=unclassified Paenibacillus TaxID=185978 RepID=UPI0036395174